MQCEIPSQGSNQSQRSDSTKSLTARPPENSKNLSLNQVFLCVFWVFVEFFVLFCFFIVFFRAPWRMEVPRLGVKLELQLTAHTTVTAIRNLSHVCDLHHSSSNTRSLTHGARQGIEPATSWILVRLISTEPRREFLNQLLFLMA